MLASLSLGLESRLQPVKPPPWSQVSRTFPHVRPQNGSKCRLQPARLPIPPSTSERSASHRLKLGTPNPTKPPARPMPWTKCKRARSNKLLIYMECAGRTQAATALWLAAERGWWRGAASGSGARSALSQRGVALRLPPYQSIMRRCFCRYPNKIGMPGTNIPEPAQ